MLYAKVKNISRKSKFLLKKNIEKEANMSKVIDTRLFRLKNNIKQQELATYMGVSSAFISQLERGKRPMPEDMLKKLINNPHGWDTSMLINGGIYAGNNNGGNVNVQVGQNKIESRNGADNSAMQIAVLEKENQMLREQIEFMKTLING